MTTPTAAEPTGWEVLRRLDRLDAVLAEQFAAVAARLDDAARSSYSRDYLDGAALAVAGRLDALEDTATRSAELRRRRFSQLLAAGSVQLLATGSAIALLHTQHI